MMVLWLGLLVILLYLVHFYIQEIINRRKGPPGPWPVPFLGSLIQVAQASSVSYLALAKIASQYGSDITRIKLGGKEHVLISSDEAINEILSNPASFGRPMDGILSFRSDGKRLGVASLEGEAWVKKRSWMIRALRDFGFNKSMSMESITKDQIHELFEILDKSISSEGGGVFDVNQAFTVPVFQIMWEIMAGKRTPEDQILISRLLEKGEKMIRSGTFGAGITSLFPFVRFLLPEWTGYNVQMDFFHDARNTARELFRDVQSKLSSEVPRNLIEAYISKTQNENDSSGFSEVDFEIFFMDFLQASSESTSSFLEAAMLFMILNPGTQAKVYQEILDCIPEGQEPTMADLQRMNYTRACILEIHRCTKVAPHFVPRRALKNFYYKNYLIKKDVTILADVHTAFNDPSKFGKDPESFRPERFIQEDGELKENRKYVIPFSVGKRKCPGEAVADVTSFLFFISIVKRFQLSCVPGKPPPTSEMNAGFSCRPFPFKMWVRKRKE